MHFRHAADNPRRPLGSTFVGQAFLAFAALLAMAFARPAAANTLPLSLEEMVAVSDIVVTARVSGLRGGMVGRHTTTTATIEILDTMKGKAKGTMELTYLGGKHEIIHVNVPQIPQLAPGQEVVLFLSQPAKRLPKEAQKSLNQSSPLVTSYQIVAGELGRFQLSTKDGQINKTRKGSDPIPSDLVVTRQAMSRADDNKSTADAPTYSNFRAAISELVAAEAQKRATKGTPDRIKGINGEFAIPTKSTNSIVRRFDPLPPIAYMTRAEVDAINEEVRQNTKAQPKEGAEN